MPEQIIDNQRNHFTTLHGSLLEVRGLGVLILGQSTIGKSENALELINRGSKLISDDLVEITKSDNNKLTGKPPERIKHLMEIRGLGIINIKELYGEAYVLNECEIDIVIELTKWDSDKEYDRLGIEQYTYNIMGIEIPYILIPIGPNRNTSTIIEIAARNQILKSEGRQSLPLNEGASDVDE